MIYDTTAESWRARDGLPPLRQKLIGECQVDRARRFANLARSAGEGVENLA
jgi:hypothetical protein